MSVCARETVVGAKHTVFRLYLRSWSRLPHTGLTLTNNWLWSIVCLRYCCFNVILQCLNWSWYLANDMQFYVISPVLLFLVFRWVAELYCENSCMRDLSFQVYWGEMRFLVNTIRRKAFNLLIQEWVTKIWTFYSKIVWLPMPIVLA